MPGEELGLWDWEAWMEKHGDIGDLANWCEREIDEQSQFGSSNGQIKKWLPFELGQSLVS